MPVSLCIMWEGRGEMQEVSKLSPRKGNSGLCRVPDRQDDLPYLGCWRITDRRARLRSAIGLLASGSQMPLDQGT